MLKLSTFIASAVLASALAGCCHSSCPYGAAAAAQAAPVVVIVAPAGAPLPALPPAGN